MEEELRATNDELQSVNEELASTSEELRSTNEELLSVNDDLRSANDRLANRARLSEALNAIDADVASTLRFDDIMQRALDRGADALGADAGTIELREDASWVVRYQQGFRAEDIGMRLSDAEAPNAVHAAASGKAFGIADMTRDAAIDVGFVRAYGLTSVIAVPLVVRGEAIGAALFYNRSHHEADEAELDFAARLGASVSLALENARLLNEERRNARMAEALATVNAILLSALTPDEVVTRLIGEVSEAAGADKSLVVEVQDGSYTVSRVRNVRNDILNVPRDGTFYSAFHLAATTRQPVLIPDAFTDDRTNKEFVVPYGLHAMQLMPVTVEDRVVAVVGFAWDAPRTFDAADEEAAQRMSAAMSVARNNARLFADERRRRELAEALAAADTAIHSAAEPDEMMREAVAEGARALAASTGAVSLHHDGAFHVRTSYGFPDDITGAVLPDEVETHTLIALETRQPVVVEDSTTDPRVVTQHMLAYGVAAVIVVPLVVSGRAIGALFYNYIEPRRFSEVEVEFARQLGSALSLALENARLFDETVASRQRLTDVLDSLTDGFVSLDREWRYTLVNPRAEEMLGRPADALLGRRMPELFPEMLGRRHYERVMGERRAETFDVWVEQSGAWLEVHAYPTADGMSILFADISERKRTEEQARRHAAALEGVGSILQSALAAKTEEELGEVCLDVAQRLTSSAFGFINEIGSDGLLHDIATSDPGWQACRVYDKSGHRRRPGDFEVRGLYGKVFAEARSFFSNAPGEEPESIGTPEGHPPLTAYLGVPLVSGGRRVGVLSVANKEGGYDESDASTLESIAPVIVEAFQRKRTERASALAKERLDAHIDNSPLAVIEFDSSFRITRWSDEAERMFGWSAHEVLGKAIGEFRWVYDEDVELVAAESRSLLTAANPRSLNVNRNYRKDGSVIWCEWYDSAIYDPDGTMVSILSQILDITERRNAEEALAKTTRRLEILAESARLLLTTSAPESVVQVIAAQVMDFLDCQVFFNYVAENGGPGMRLNAYAGIPEEEARRIAHLNLGEAVCGCVARDGVRILAEDVQHTADERTQLVKSYGVQAYACHPLVFQGQTIGTLSFGTTKRTAFTAEETELMRAVADQAATAMARRQAEDRLLASRSQIDEERGRLRTIIDEMPMGVTLLDADGSVIEINEANRRIWAGEPPRTRSVKEYGVYRVFDRETGEPFPPERLPAVRTLSTGEPGTVVADIDRLDGSRATVRFTSFPTTDDSGRITGAMVVTEDVTAEVERERLDEALGSIRTAIGSTLDVAEIVHEAATRAGETLRTDAIQIVMRRGDRWVVTDAHGMNSKPGEVFSDEDMPLSRSAVLERRPIVEFDAGGRASKRRVAMRRFGVRSIIIIPLIAQGRGIGVIGLGHAEAIPISDLETYFATQLASIATLALDNALAYEREHAIAETLQEAILAPPVDIAGIQTAYLYRPASTEAAVGGDFYDIFELDGGKVAMLVGDVSGKGLEAARLTSLVRDGIRAYAFERDDPAWVVDRMNTLMYRSSPVEAFATLFFGVLDVLSGDLRYTAAGHPPAVLCSASGPAYLAETHSALVGGFPSAQFAGGAVRLGPEDTLVLYTDGVIEARRDSELYGDARVLDALGRLSETPLGLLPQALLDDVLAFSGGVLRDDTVIVCVRRALKTERTQEEPAPDRREPRLADER